MFRVPGQTDTAGDQRGVAFEIKRQLQGLQQPLNPLDTGLLSAHKQKGELVPPQAAETVLAIEHLHETRSSLLQQEVTHRMPKAVIDLLEAVNIQHQHRQTFVAIDGRLQALIEQQSVRQASNGVVMCQALQLRL
ncbi:hypothetical protein D3C79_525870 [compost metagenome]